jgi:hypothetical protein
MVRNPKSLRSIRRQQCLTANEAHFTLTLIQLRWIWTLSLVMFASKIIPLVTAEGELHKLCVSLCHGLFLTVTRLVRMRDLSVNLGQCFRTWANRSISTITDIGSLPKRPSRIEGIYCPYGPVFGAPGILRIEHNSISFHVNACFAQKSLFTKGRNIPFLSINDCRALTLEYWCWIKPINTVSTEGNCWTWVSWRLVDDLLGCRASFS